MVPFSIIMVVYFSITIYNQRCQGTNWSLHWPVFFLWVWLVLCGLLSFFLPSLFHLKKSPLKIQSGDRFCPSSVNSGDKLGTNLAKQMITKKCFDKKRIRPQHYLTPDNKWFTGILVVFYVFFITASFSDAECSFPHAGNKGYWYSMS